MVAIWLISSHIICPFNQFQIMSVDRNRENTLVLVTDFENTASL